MNLIPRVKCRRCGTEYSVLQSTCPKCGTRKSKQSQRAPGTTSGTVAGTYANEQAQVNARWQMTFAVILVVAVVLATIVLITTSLNTRTGVKTTPTPTPTPTANVTPTPTPKPTPTPTPTPTITSVTLKYSGSTMQEFTIRPGENVQLTAEIYPILPEGSVTPVVWSSSAPEVCTVSDSGMVTGVGTTGKATITASCFGVEATCTVYARS